MYEFMYVCTCTFNKTSVRCAPMHTNMIMHSFITFVIVVTQPTSVPALTVLGARARTVLKTEPTDATVVTVAGGGARTKANALPTNVRARMANM